MAIVVLARLPLSGSLWLDEGITAWVVRDSLGAAIDRAVQFQGQSPLYFILVWAVQLFGVQLFGGSNEGVLRLLSLVAIMGSLGMLFVIARRLAGSSLAWLSITLLLTLDPIQVAAVSARPYALALFFSLAAVWALLRWEEDGRYRYSVLYLGFFLASVYLQYLFVCMLAVHALHVALFFRAQRVAIVSYISELLLVAALLVPAFLHLAELAEHRAILQFVPRPSISSLLRSVAPPALMIAVMMGMVLASLASGGFAVNLGSAKSKRSIWVGWWWLFPPVLYFALSTFGTASIFLERYFLFYAPGVAIGYAALILAWRNERARAVCLCASVAMLMIRELDRRWVTEDWRGAARVLAAQGAEFPALVAPGLAESRNLEWLEDDSKQEYLLAPLIYYRTQNPLAILPTLQAYESEGGREYVARIFQALFPQGAQGFFVGLEQKTSHGNTITGWLDILKSVGFETTEIMFSRDSSVRAFHLRRVTASPALGDRDVSKDPVHSAAQSAAPVQGG